jgi:hypothetical protein
MTDLSVVGRPRLIVCGTRTFDDWRRLYKVLDALTAKLTRPIVCTGAGRHYKKVNGKLWPTGADHWAETWAYARGHTVMLFHADQDLKPPGCYHHRRNREMVDFVRGRGGFACAVWDGKSPGTKSVIDLCRKYGISIYVQRY